MENMNNGGRRPSDKPRVYSTYDVERIKAQNARRTNESSRPVRPSYDPAQRSASSVGRYSDYDDSESYSRRRPSSRSSHNNGDAGLWMLIIVIAVMVIGAFIFLISYLKDDGNAVNTDIDETEEIEETARPVETSPETAPETVPPELAAPVPEFSVDLSAYEMYMNPTGEQRDAYLTLVNSKNPLPSDYVPPDLIDVKCTRKDGRATQKLREYAAKALEALMLEADACGMVNTNTPSKYPLSVMSAYRSYEYQHELFYDRYLVNEMNKGLSREDAEKKVATYSNRPGTSEHQAGLCVDIHTLSAANQIFKNEPQAKWLAENCHKFGFILRYPEDKLEQTGGIMYEPWHFRYVGRYHATRMKELNMCLEEYVEYLKNNG